MDKMIDFQTIKFNVWKHRNSKFGDQAEYLFPVDLMRFAIAESGECYSAYFRLDDSIIRTNDREENFFDEFDDFVFVLISSLGKDFNVAKLRLKTMETPSMARVIDGMVYFLASAMQSQKKEDKIINETAASHICSALALAENMPGWTYNDFLDRLN